MDEINLYQLRTFYSVARHLNYSRAGDELSLSQPAVSRQVAALEKNIGLELFVQKGRQVELTDAGRSLFEYADRIFELTKQAERTLSQFKDLEKGNVLIGACTTLGSYVLPPVIHAFHDRHPNINISLRIGNSQEIEQLVAERKLDLGLVDGYANKPAIHVEPYIKDELVMIFPPENPLHGKKEVTARDFADETLLLPEKGSPARALVEHFLKDRKIVFNKLVEIGSTEAIKSLVTANMGTGFVSKYSLSLEMSIGKLKILDINECKIPLRYYVILAKDQHYYPTAIAFLNFIRK